MWADIKVSKLAAVIALVNTIVTMIVGCIVFYYMKPAAMAGWAIGLAITVVVSFIIDIIFFHIVGKDKSVNSSNSNASSTQ